MTHHIRPILETDEPFLWQMIFYAARMHDEPGKSVADAMQNPTLALYVTGWGRLGDIGFVAEEVKTRQLLGAAWVRLYTGDDKAYGETDDNTPELAMALLPEYTGQGIGTALLTKLIAATHHDFPILALNVRADNPALRLYQRCGFIITNEMTNRVGGLSYDMRLFR